MNKQLRFGPEADDARYQRCAAVQRLAERLRIERLFLPSYSPNLNLIERLWGFVEEVLSCRYYEDSARFEAAIVECLGEIEGELKLSIDSLRTFNSQTLEKPHLRDG